MNEQIVAAVGLRQIERRALLVCAAWGLLSLLVFGVGLLLQNRPDSYVLAVSLLKMGSFLIAAALCWRNSRNPDILSGHRVWQAIAAVA